MYWNEVFANANIGQQNGLTLTWDVLKSSSSVSIEDCAID